jgi:hypothetical protein
VFYAVAGLFVCDKVVGLHFFGYVALGIE